MVIYGTPIPTRPLGKNGPQVSAIGYGAMGIAIGYGLAKPDEQRLKILDAVVENGIYFIDTSDFYADSEALIGKWLGLNPGLREKIFLATKFGIVGDPGFNAPQNGKPEYVKSAIEKSLKNLGTDYVDLYYYHRIEKEVPIEVTMQALKELKQAGKIKHIGLSECSAETIRRAHAIEPLTAVQLEYSPFSLDIEDPSLGIISTCRELGIAIVCYSPLCRGLVTGRFRSQADFGPGDLRGYLPRFNVENLTKNLELVDRIKALANKKSVTPAQLTLAWELGRGNDFIPIPGTVQVEAMRENLGTINIHLTEEEREEITKAARDCPPTGERYPPQLLHELFSDTIKLEDYTPSEQLGS
ncbi:hypothetical protein Dda_3249 [Drechslerella dactyloides]|uniref:NADP-dependent oxidoreductase domain-containing protein n=1 Tax=Drechslerella dactyloides TaxID=74499 RepID=A0AAD6J5E6_DREDA|nr:hypothetical protein Dda_3249 [Drechslerella dactyloides]